MTRFLPAALLLFLAGFPLRADDAKTAKPVVVPFQIVKTKHITVDVKVNGKGPYRVLFDTGSPTTLLNTTVAKEAGLPGGRGLLGIAQVKAKTLEIGGLKVEDVPAIVMDHPLIELISQDKDIGFIYGIVGLPFFARFRTTLDYKAKTLTFVPNGFEPSDVIKELMATVMGMTGGKEAPPKVLAPAAQWGLVADKAKDDDAAGVTIKEVLPGGAAAAGGLKAGDRLLTLDGRWTDSLADLYTAASFIKPGTAVKVVVNRANKEMTLTVTPTTGL
jgi:hypothetical protein